MITIRCIKNFDEAEELWRRLSPNASLFDAWELRYCSYKHTNDELFFYTAFDGDEPVALLPLQLTTAKGYLEFFGGVMMEDNRFFYTPGHEAVLSHLVAAIQQPARLCYMVGSDPFTTSLTPMEDGKYVLNLTEHPSTDEYIQHVFSGETKKKFIKRIRKVAETGDVTIARGHAPDLELLFEFNIKKFKNASIFNLPFRKDIYREMFTAFPSSLLTYSVGGQKQAVGFGVIYNHGFYSFNTSVNPGSLPDLSTYVRINKIDEAIALGATLYDAMADDLGWKRNWHLTMVPLYEIILPNKNRPL